MIFFICAKSAIFSMDNQSFFLLVFDGILAPVLAEFDLADLRQSDKIKLKRTLSISSWNSNCGITVCPRLSLFCEQYLQGI